MTRLRIRSPRLPQACSRQPTSLLELGQCGRLSGGQGRQSCHPLEMEQQAWLFWLIVIVPRKEQIEPQAISLPAQQCAPPSNKNVGENISSLPRCACSRGFNCLQAWSADGIDAAVESREARYLRLVTSPERYIGIRSLRKTLAMNIASRTIITPRPLHASRVKLIVVFRCF